MKKIFTLLSVIVAQLVSGQEDYTFTTSGENYMKAYEHLSQEEYTAAFDYFGRVHKSDTLYDVVILNKLIAEYTAKFYKKTIKSCDEVIENHSLYKSEAYYYKIKALTDLRKYDEAQELITKGLKEYPLYFRYNYLKALMLKDQGKYEEAKKMLQDILKVRPQHSSSHYSLAQIHAEEGAETQAIFGFQMAIIVNRSSPVLNASFEGMADVMQGNYEISREQEDVKPYKKLNNLIVSGLALKNEYKADMPIRYTSNVVTDLMFNQFSYKEDNSDFTMDYYGRFFNEVKKKGLEKGYILYFLGLVQDPYVQKLVSTHKRKIEAFEKFQEKYWQDQLNSHKFKVNDKIYERDYRLDNRGILSAVGQRNDEDKRIGKWTFFYPSGQVRAETEYNDEGKLTGQNTWYAEDGYVKESGVYEDGKLNGFAYFTREDGTATYDGVFKDNKLEGEVKIYTDEGILQWIKMFKDNKVNGTVQEFYENGKLATTFNVKEGEREGKLVVVSASGDTVKVKSYSKGKPVGAYKEYYLNGSVMTKGQYKSGKRNGRWVDYYYDGNIAFKYGYKAGSLHGDYVKFTSGGDTILHKEYLNGILNGVDKDYIENNRILWEHVFKNGKLKKYYNYSPDGELISKGKKGYTLNDRFGYKYVDGTKKGNNFHGPYTVYFKNGNIKEERNYRKGTLQGEYKEYFSWGGIDEEKYYKDGSLHGEYKSYFDNGNLYAEGHYFEGYAIGPWKYYHPNGILKKELYYSDGVNIGHMTMYSITGEKRANYFYNGGILYRTQVFDKNGKEVCNIKTPQGKGEYIFKSVGGHNFLKSKLDGGEHHGQKQFYFPNGQVLETVNKNHGESHGDFKSFYPNGTVKEVGRYVYGNKQGEWKVYHHNGKLKTRVVYENDLVKDSLVRYYITGEVKEIEYYDKNGESITSKYMHSSGAMNCIVPTDGGFTHGEYANHDAFGEVAINRIYNGGQCVSYNYKKDGKLTEPKVINGNGNIKTYYNNGKLASQYKEKGGLYEGAYKRMHSNGNPWVEASYLHDKKHGNYKAYYADGTLRFECNYKYNRKNGVLKKYNKNGKLLMEEKYNEGVRDGICKYYDDKGKLLYTLTYKDDVVIKVN